MVVNISLGKNIFGNAVVSKDNLIGIFGLNPNNHVSLNNCDIIHRLRNPIGTASISELVKDKKKIVIVTDDNTRSTPLYRILPLLLAEINRVRVKPDNILILIGLGTHRPMTNNEIMAKFGAEIVTNYQIRNHDWEDPDCMISLGMHNLGFEVVINKFVKDADFIISIGNVVPHATTGFSGGGKSVMPGVCGCKTIADTHWAALDYQTRDLLGSVSNKIRDGIVSVCKMLNVGLIVDVISSDEKVSDLFIGDIELAHNKAVNKCMENYGVSIPKLSDITIAEAFPMDIDLRQSIKALCAADCACKKGGVIILCAECIEGISPQFPEFIKYGFRDPESLYNMASSVMPRNKLLFYTLVAIGKIIQQQKMTILVSPNINKMDTENLGFSYSCNLQTAVDMAFNITGKYATISILRNASTILPLIDKKR